MVYKRLEFTVISARYLKKPNLIIGKMDVYAVVSLTGDPRYRYRHETTPVHRDGDCNPYWNSKVAFIVDEAKLASLVVAFDLKHKRAFLWDKKVGRVRVLVSDLLHKKGQTSYDFSTFSYQVRAPSGEYKGDFEFSVKISDSNWTPPPPPPPVVYAPQPRRATYGYPYGGYHGDHGYDYDYHHHDYHHDYHHNYHHDYHHNYHHRHHDYD